MAKGWISSYRKMLDNQLVCKDSDHYATWGYLIHSATHKGYKTWFKNELIELQPGQLITSRRSISEKFKISDSKVQRILKAFENAHQIEQQTGNKSRLITVLNWSRYQKYERLNEQLLNNRRTTTEQQLNTNNNVNYILHDNLRVYITKEQVGLLRDTFGDEIFFDAMDMALEITDEKLRNFRAVKEFCIIIQGEE